MIFHWPQATIAVVLVLGLGIELERHGNPRTGKHNVWTVAIATIIVAALLYAGGFWTGGVAP